ncbi:MAG: hypothetical protein AB8F65_12565 [Woeseiaceae bacterium]
MADQHGLAGVRKSGVVTVVILFLFWAVSVPAMADETPKFARIVDDAAGAPKTLQIAIARYTGQFEGRKRTVDLVGAVHIGEPEYYAELNERFADYDAVLYELVAPSGTRVEPGAEPDGWLSRTQFAMTQGLDLSFQLDEIDYQAENFVHADLSPSEFGQAMRDRGESPIVIAWRLFSFSIAESARNAMPQNQAEMLKDVLASSGQNGLKTMLARELTKTDQMAGIFGDDAGNSIIGARNERAIDILASRMSSTTDDELAIFYGVAHLPDFHARMTQQLEFELDEVIWVDGWQL